MPSAQNRAFNGSSIVWTPSGGIDISYSVKTGTFLGGELVSQAGSSATGRFLYDDSSKMHFQLISGTFDASHVITGASSGATVTPTAEAASAAVTISAAIVSIKPDVTTKEIDVSGAGEPEIIEAGQEKDTLSIEHVGPTIAGLYQGANGTLSINRADGTTRNMNLMCLAKIAESGAKNQPWTTTLSFAGAHALNA
jgi:hypothetical protein